MTDLPGRRVEDQSEPATIFTYRLGQLEHAFKGFQDALDTKLHDHGELIDEKLKGFENKLDEALFNKGVLNLIDYRLRELEKWKQRTFAAITTVATGLILLLLTQIILLATAPGGFPGSPR